MSYGFEPHGTILAGRTAVPLAVVHWYRVAVGGGVPGVVRDWGGREGAIPGTHPVPSLGPIFSIYLRLGPTYGQMKAFLVIR